MNSTDRTAAPPAQAEKKCPAQILLPESSYRRLRLAAGRRTLSIAAYIRLAVLREVARDEAPGDDA